MYSVGNREPLKSDNQLDVGYDKEALRMTSKLLSSKAELQVVHY